MRDAKKSAIVFAAVGMLMCTSLPSLADDAVQSHTGQLLYQENCAACHDAGAAEAPLTEALRKLSSDHIFRAMNDGIMLVHAGHLSPDERREIADYLGVAGGSTSSSEAAVEGAYCPDEPGLKQVVTVSNWGLGLNNARYSKADITPQNATDLELEWAFAFPDSARARAQPTIAGDTVYTAAQNGKIYALDINSGCIQWERQVEAEVRSAIAIDVDSEGNAARLFFGDFEGNVYGFDLASRQIIWTIRADSHPVTTITGSLVVYGDTIFVPVSSREVVSAANPSYECCTFRGSIIALDKYSGEKLWQTYTTDEPEPQGLTSVGTKRFGPSGAPIWSSPTIDPKRGRLYVGTGENYTMPATGTSDAIIALSLESGAIEWVNQVTKDDAWNGSCGRTAGPNCPEKRGPDYDFGAPPILATLPSGKDIILAGQKSGMVYAMDPDNAGALLWQNQVGRGGIMGGIHWGMATDGEVLYVPISDLSVYPWDAHKPAQSGMHAIEAATGKFKWKTLTENVCGEAKWRCSPGLSAAATLGSDGVVIGGGLDGVVHVFDAGTGAILWSDNTNRTFDAVNGIPAEGGSLDSDGPVLAGDRMLLTSGYDKWGQKFGNVLLSYRIKETIQ